VLAYALRTAAKSLPKPSLSQTFAIQVAFSAVFAAAACFTLNLAWAAAVGLFVYKAQPSEEIVVDLFCGLVTLASAIGIANLNLTTNIGVWIATAAVYGTDELELGAIATPLTIALIVMPHTNTFWLALLVLIILGLQYILQRKTVAWLEKTIKISLLVTILATPVGWPHNAELQYNPIPPEWDIPPCTKDKAGTLRDALGAECFQQGIPCPLNYNKEVGKELVCGGNTHGACKVTQDMTMAYCVCEQSYCGALKFVPSSQSFVHLACTTQGKNCGKNGAPPLQEENNDPLYGLSSKNNCNCVCEVGFYGPFCNLTCPKNDQDFVCSNYGTCIVQNNQAFCNCDTGYEGDDCATQVCSGNGNLVNGKCVCSTEENTNYPRYVGKECEVQCPTNCTHGFPHDDGNSTCSCKCYAGYKGETCAECADNSCALNATCQTDGVCACNNTKHDITTFCTSCTGNFVYPDCSKCSTAFYGANCDKTCQCNGFACNQETGACICPDELGGSSCECTCKGMIGGKCENNERFCVCEPDRCGKNCENNCDPTYGSCENFQCVCVHPPASSTADCVPSDQAWMLRYR